ncbi:hypothetical protein HELRODRAFT_141265, partial [Helobdella robusta]|uniref:Adenosine 3'-phospho 5'-phosphosulfate transporter 1 n=1 Tax=Helobdella robusta TaxID=6412 RepID=T1EJ32_HELRO
WQDIWWYRLLTNLFNYSTIIIPCFLLVFVIKRTKYLERAGRFFNNLLLKLFIDGRELSSFEEINMKKPAYNTSQNSSATLSLFSFENKFVATTVKLCFYSCGLLLSYLIWGIVQERVMVYEYKDNTTGRQKGERFTNSQFIVFANRVLAFVVAVVGIRMLEQPCHRAPFYKYIYCSFSNIMSSWCQYEALKFVSFPVQVLAKTIKVIPVMLMGRVISRRSYSVFEYITASMISAGVFIFLITSEDGPGSKSSDSTHTSISGVVILIGYLMFDSFTSNWQDDLFNKFKVTSLQMMAGVNFFSVLLTWVSLMEQGTFTEALSFASRHPSFTLHILILSITSAIGQLFIFATIANFGPATFTIVMTIRQGLAILLSCIIYGHQVRLSGGIGVAIVFASLFIRVY